ncbi:thiamine phosphate synthase [Sporosarcina sp. Te-1]|uniref:thiamine phosphate synthase n=1 Tax=Sporosarcina sp. Te-1 TaxID=2818390 RepID=UPI001A9CE133|nr:thiamine phosphate synthase [Sporosarcina sp. Te-1]QTD43529.1 thiamine phosphate synthase [Sporosarcina sp. Te-1]
MGTPNAEKPLDVLEKALLGGITCFQLREKGPGSLQGTEKMAFAQSCQRLCKQYGVPFFVNDDVELAIALEADGVHVGQEDEEAGSIRQKIGSHMKLGVSVHTAEEAWAAQAAGAAYVGLGPIYPTQTKLDAKPVAGTSMIAEVTRLIPELPIVGIGGICASNAGPVIQSGASGISVISAIAAAEDPEQATANLKKVLCKALMERSAAL